MMQVLFLVIGFVILIKGADIFVDGASAVAGHFKVSKILIGLTIVAFGTSAPEFAVSVKAIISHNHDIVLGNVIGSNIMNIFLILGVSSLFHSLKVRNNTVKKELPITLLITSLFVVLLSDGLFDKNVVNAFTRSDGVILLLFFMVYAYYLISISRNKIDTNQNEKYMPLLKSVILTVGGIIAIVIGSNFVVDSAASLAAQIGISEKMISLTIIALGTSLPELVTSITATRKGEYDLAIGNIIGSNVFNIGLVVGLPVALFGGVDHISFNYIDVIAMILAAFLLYVFSSTDKKITRSEGLVLLGVFIVYYGYVILVG